MAGASGGCLCGKVRFTADNIETGFHACHCGMCRRWTSSPMFVVTAEKLSFDGAAEPAVYESSEWAERGFCGNCGSTLFYRLKSGEYFMSVGAFDDASPFKMKGEIYVDHHPGGYKFSGDLEQMTEADILSHFAPPE